MLFVPLAARASLTTNQSPLTAPAGGLTVLAAPEQSIREILLFAAVWPVVFSVASLAISKSFSVASRDVSARTVTVRVAPAVVIIPAPAAMVAVCPSDTV